MLNLEKLEHMTELVRHLKRGGAIPDQSCLDDMLELIQAHKEHLAAAPPSSEATPITSAEPPAPAIPRKGKK